MNRFGPGMLIAISVALTAQAAIASRAAESAAARAGAVKAKHDAALAAKPMPKAVVPTKRASAPGKAAVAATPISAWRAAYIAKHHHEPPAKTRIGAMGR
jgi:hypothetical protein